MVGDRDGVVAGRTARAARALQGGQIDAAQVILEELLPHIDGRGDSRTGVFLRVRLAAALSRLGRRAAALEWLRAARDRSAAGSALRLTVVAEAMRVQLDDGQPEAALDLGTEALDQPEDADPSSPEPTLHAELLVLCAVALRQLRRPELAEQARHAPGASTARAWSRRARASGSSQISLELTAQVGQDLGRRGRSGRRRGLGGCRLAPGLPGRAAHTLGDRPFSWPGRPAVGLLARVRELPRAGLPAPILTATAIAAAACHFAPRIARPQGRGRPSSAVQ